MGRHDVTTDQPSNAEQGAQINLSPWADKLYEIRDRALGKDDWDTANQLESLRQLVRATVAQQAETIRGLDAVIVLMERAIASLDADDDDDQSWKFADVRDALMKYRRDQAQQQQQAGQQQAGGSQ
jgi:hypothetical protein